MDQENICGVLPEKHLSAANNTHPYGSDTIMKHNMAASSKRPLNDTVNETNPKRIKMVDSVATGGKKTKTSRRKLVPLSKGQKTLNAFFRIWSGAIQPELHSFKNTKNELFSSFWCSASHSELCVNSINLHFLYRLLGLYLFIHLFLLLIKNLYCAVFRHGLFMYLECSHLIALWNW